MVAGFGVGNVKIMAFFWGVVFDLMVAPKRLLCHRFFLTEMHLPGTDFAFSRRVPVSGGTGSKPHRDVSGGERTGGKAAATAKKQVESHPGQSVRQQTGSIPLAWGKIVPIQRVTRFSSCNPRGGAMGRERKSMKRRLNQRPMSSRRSRL